jgi:hypothetical protein
MVKYVKKMSHTSTKTINGENKTNQVCEIFGHWFKIYMNASNVIWSYFWRFDIW